MEFIDVIFPINLGPLTYKCPDDLIDKALPGMLVLAPLKKQEARGIIVGRSTPTARITPTIRDISEIHGESPLLEQPLLKLLNWMSEYYHSNKGIVLKNMLPKEAFKKIKARKKQTIEHREQDTEFRQSDEIDKNILSKITGSLGKKEYSTFLFHAPTLSHELSFISKLIRVNQNAIVLVPEIAYLNHMETLFKELIGEKLCILHSGMSKGMRSDAYEKIISGQCSVVLGTRMAVFAPLKNVSMIIAMQEQSSSYKTEEGLRFNARDIAVMRGYLEKTTVVLSSITPSIESFYNAKHGKYSLLKQDAAIKRPRIRIINMYQDKQPSPGLTKTVISAAQTAINKNEKAMFIINRKGYSMLTCKDCGHIETCDKCGIPLIFHKNDKSLRCHYCGFKSDSPEKCKKCKGVDIELTGSGIQRIEESLKKIFNVEAVRLDSDSIKKSSKLENISDFIKGEAVVIGTKLLTRRIQASEDFGMAAVLNADIYLNLPDFRSAEKAYQEFAGIAAKIKPEGTLFIQTRMPQNHLFRFLKNHDYYGFCEEELLKRKEMLYPPYSKIATIAISGRDYDDNKVRNFIKKKLGKDLEIFGPSISSGKKGLQEYGILIKSISKQKLQAIVTEFLKLFEGCKDLKINAAIDP